MRDHDLAPRRNVAAHFDASAVADAATSRHVRAEVKAILAQRDTDDASLNTALVALAAAAPGVVVHVLVRDATLSWHLVSLRDGACVRHEIALVPALPETTLAAELLGIFRDPGDPAHDPVAELHARWEPRVADAEVQSLVSALWPGQGGTIKQQSPNHPERQ